MACEQCEPCWTGTGRFDGQVEEKLTVSGPGQARHPLVDWAAHRPGWSGRSRRGSLLGWLGTQLEGSPGPSSQKKMEAFESVATATASSATSLAARLAIAKRLSKNKEMQRSPNLQCPNATISLVMF